MDTDVPESTAVTIADANPAVPRPVDATPDVPEPGRAVSGPSRPVLQQLGRAGAAVGVAFGTVGEAIDHSPIGRLVRRRAT